MKNNKKLFICICTKKINQNLKKLLQTISVNNYSDKLKVEVLITINNLDKISFIEKKNIKKILKNIKFYIINEPIVGVSHARNKCLKFLRNKNFDYGCFLDDDCIVGKDYIKNNLDFILENKCDVVTGPQISLSKIKFNKVFERNFHHKKKIKWASTNNVFFKKKIIKNDMIFSNYVTKYGFGEDQLFFSKLTQKQFSIRWNKFNYVYEQKNKNREKIKWFLKRNLNYGLTGILIDISLYGKFNGIIVNFLKSFYNFALFFIYLFLIPFNLKINLYFSLSFILRGLGRTLGIFKI